MHREVSDFIADIKVKYPEFFKGKKVLEVGSLDINGSVRGFFEDCDYTGLDIGEGPGVDVVCPIHKFIQIGQYDVIISTEMLEHDVNWRDSLLQMYHNLKKGGLFILTCAGPTRQEHGTTRTTPGDSPFTNDYYRNISIQDFTSVIPDEEFIHFNLGLYRGGADLCFYGVKRGVESPKKELIFLSASSDDTNLAWQYEVFIENVREKGYTEEIRILLWLPHDRVHIGWNPYWDMLEKRYANSNVRIFRYADHENFLSEIQSINYISLLRPHILEKHFRENPELSEKAIFYHDCDIMFTKYLDFSPYLNDDVCYLSNTPGYIDSDYWYSKIKDVKQEILELYKLVDPLDQCSKLLGINKYICGANRERSGGAQYILKNIDANYWKDVTEGCKIIRRYLAYELGGINATFFVSENAGFQSWCADMWAVLWNLWKRNIITSVPREMDMIWATDDIVKEGTAGIYHNAGVNETNQDYLFFKGDEKYKSNRAIPFFEDLSYVSPKYCSKIYVEEINKVRDKYYTKRV